MNAIPNPSAADLRALRSLVDGPSEVENLRRKIGKLRFALDLSREREETLQRRDDESKAREDILQRRLDTVAAERALALRDLAIEKARPDKWRGRFAMAVMIPALLIIVAGLVWAWRAW